LNAGTTSFTITKLTEGKIYNFQVVAKYTNDSVSTPVIIKWSPATRFELNVNDDVIKVYETDSDFGSGLMMYDPTGGAPKVRKVANGADWDLGLDTRSSKVIFGSATKINYSYTGTPKPTQIFGDKYFETESLNSLFDSQAMNAGGNDIKYVEKTFDITTETSTKNLVFYVRKADATGKYNYAKVMIIKNPSGAGYLQGASSNRYIELQISYQKVVDVPYAKVANDNDTN
jgi:hypothetical protein